MVKFSVPAFTSRRGGTLFLDEVGEVPLPSYRPSWLRIFRKGNSVGLGEQSPSKRMLGWLLVPIGNMEDQVREGTFREDLFYLIYVVQVRHPALPEGAPGKL